MNPSKRLIVSVFLATRIGFACAQATPATPPVPHYDELWVMHASYQSHKRDDYIDPLLVRAMVHEAAKTPNLNYTDLVQQATQLRAQFAEEVGAAKTGKISDPFSTESQVTAWAKKLAPFTKNALAISLAEIADDAFQLGSAATIKLTSLDAQQQIEYQSLLYRESIAHAGDIFSEALKASESNPRLRAALNTFLGPALDVQIGDTLADIRAKSPEIVTELFTEQILAQLQAGQLTPAIKDLITKKLGIIDQQTADAYADLKKLLDQQTSAQQREQIERAAVQKEQYQQAEIEAARAGLALVGKIAGPNASSDMRKALALGNEGIQAWESVSAYEKTVRTTEGSEALAGAALTFNLAGVMFDVVQLTWGNSNPAEDATTLVLRELNTLKSMVADLYDMTSQRFDRLEGILESYQRMNADAFSLLINRSAITAQQLDQVRASLTAIEAATQQVRDEVDRVARSSSEAKFAELRRKCYEERQRFGGGDELSRDAFTNCLQEFAGLAMDVSRSAPFVPSGTEPDPNLSLQTDGPLAAELYLLKTAQTLGSSGVHLPAIQRNAYVWSSALTAYLSTLETWPKLVSDTDLARLKDLVDAGEELRGSWGSILNMNCDGHLCDQVNVALFQRLLDVYAEQLLGVGRAANGVVETYQAGKGLSVNPFRNANSKSMLTAADDQGFFDKLPSRTRRCNNNQDLPDDIPTPKALIRLVPEQYRLAERLDPSGHAVTLCYDVVFRDWRKALVNPNAKPQFGYNFRYFWYFGTPWLEIVVHMPDSDFDPIVSVTLPDMVFSNTNSPVPAYEIARDTGSFDSGPSTTPANFTFNKSGNLYKVAFPYWIKNGGFDDTFEKHAILGVRKAGVDIPVAPSDWQSTDEKLSGFVQSEIQRQRDAACTAVADEFSRVGDLQKAMARLDDTKRLLGAYLSTVLPVSASDSVMLQISSVSGVYVYPTDLEWRALAISGRQEDTPAARLNAGLTELIEMGNEEIKPTWHGGNGIIAENYRKLYSAVVNATTGHELPEGGPMFTATLGLAKKTLKAGPPARQSH